MKPAKCQVIFRLWGLPGGALFKVPLFVSADKFFLDKLIFFDYNDYK
jgi:hypothetical protein